MAEKRYKYAGPDGRFVPALPEEITDSEAKERGLDALLSECLKAGLYKEVKDKAAKPKAKES